MNGNNTIVWTTGTNGTDTAPYKLVMQGDGNLVIYGKNKAVWSTGTNERGTASVLKKDYPGAGSWTGSTVFDLCDNN